MVDINKYMMRAGWDSEKEESIDRICLSGSCT